MRCSREYFATYDVPSVMQHRAALLRTALCIANSILSVTRSHSGVVVDLTCSENWLSLDMKKLVSNVQRQYETRGKRPFCDTSKIANPISISATVTTCKSILANDHRFCTATHSSYTRKLQTLMVSYGWICLDMGEHSDQT